MSIAITTLVENSMSDHKALGCEHGLSFHIQTPQSNFLFDCGASDRLVSNAEKLGIDLSLLDFVVCSHGHYDHTGGFRAVATRSMFKRFITGDSFFIPKYVRDGIRHTFLGVDFGPDFLNERGIAHEICGDIMQLDDFCWLVGNFERTAPDENVPSRLVLRRDGVFTPDQFAEEICLVVRFREGLAILAGCSHPGIMNIIDTVQRRLDLPILGVWGGTHLSNAKTEKIAAIIEAMKGTGVKYFGLSHCSGENMLECIKHDSSVIGCHLRTGDGLFF